MTNDKGMEYTEEKEEEFVTDGSTRARNRTVMLTPDITGQVRAMLTKEMGSGNSGAEFNPAYLGSSQDAAPLASTYQPAGDNARPAFGSSAERRSAAQPSHAQLSAPTSAPAAHPAAAQHTREQPQRAVAAAVKATPIVGFMVSFDKNINGDVVELRQGRWIVSSEPTSSSQNFIILDDDTVSPLHAIVRVSPRGEIQVLDQLSEHGTAVKKASSEVEETLTGSMSSLEHGDIVRFGQRSFNVCLIQKID
jgi:hypothetical protein